MKLEWVAGGEGGLGGGRQLCPTHGQHRAFSNLALKSSFTFFLLPCVTNGKLNSDIPIVTQLVLEASILRLGIAYNLWIKSIA